MNIGELWVAHSLFPWLMIVLTLWVGFSTASQVRNWVRIRRLERHNKLLQEMVLEGVGAGSVARQVRGIQLPESSKRQEESPCELCSGKTGVRTEEPATAAIEEPDENGDNLPVVESENTKRESVRST